jgi:hypothetical protein
VAAYLGVGEKVEKKGRKLQRHVAFIGTGNKWVALGPVSWCRTPDSSCTGGNWHSDDFLYFGCSRVRARLV